jgi:hypothetical protein
MLLSHAGDSAAETTWLRRDINAESCWRQCCRVMLASALSSHAGDSAARGTWSQRDVDAESC